jgi:hypothetical protein
MCSGCLNKTTEALCNINTLAEDILRHQVLRQLTSLADIGRTQIEHYFEQIKN